MSYQNHVAKSVNIRNKAKTGEGGLTSGTSRGTTSDIILWQFEGGVCVAELWLKCELRELKISDTLKLLSRVSLFTVFKRFIEFPG